jgi:hypothetical protein
MLLIPLATMTGMVAPAVAHETAELGAIAALSGPVSVHGQQDQRGSESRRIRALKASATESATSPSKPGKP